MALTTEQYLTAPKHSLNPKQRDFIKKILLHAQTIILTSKNPITINVLEKMHLEYFCFWQTISYIDNIMNEESPYIPNIVIFGLIVTFDDDKQLVNCYTSMDVFDFLHSFVPNKREVFYSYSEEILMYPIRQKIDD